jgi:hypothetical protein
MKTKNNSEPRIENYSLTASNGRHIRTATRIVFQDGRSILFTEKMSKRLALAQLQYAIEQSAMPAFRP